MLSFPFARSMGLSPLDEVRPPFRLLQRNSHSAAAGEVSESGMELGHGPQVKCAAGAIPPTIHKSATLGHGDSDLPRHAKICQLDCATTRHHGAPPGGDGL